MAYHGSKAIDRYKGGWLGVFENRPSPWDMGGLFSFGDMNNH